MKNKIIYITLILIIGIFAFSVISLSKNPSNTISTSGEVLSNKKIEWGIKRNNNHEQPDLGSKNKELMNKYLGICIGNSSDSFIYLTFDMGYEAGYTKKILEVLKQNDVKAAFFITAHYVNTAPELVQRMIDEGHIVGNQSPHALMDL